MYNFDDYDTSAKILFIIAVIGIVFLLPQIGVWAWAGFAPKFGLPLLTYSEVLYLIVFLWVVIPSSSRKK